MLLTHKTHESETQIFASEFSDSLLCTSIMVKVDFWQYYNMTKMKNHQIDLKNFKAFVVQQDHKGAM